MKESNGRTVVSPLSLLAYLQFPALGTLLSLVWITLRCDVAESFSQPVAKKVQQPLQRLFPLQRSIRSECRVGGWTTSSHTIASVSSLSPKTPIQRIQFKSRLSSRVGSGISDDAESLTEEDGKIQWHLFQKHHARCDSSGDQSLGTKRRQSTSWKGVWTTYDYMGDVLLEAVAAVNYNTIIPISRHEDNQGEADGPDGNGAPVSIEQVHSIVVGATRSDCPTCFDSMETKDIPVAVYRTPNDLLTKKIRLGACGMVTGPTLLRNGAMTTELALSHGDGRLRVTFQYAPVWERRQQDDDDGNDENGMSFPDGLKLFRIVVSREALRSTAPTAETEQELMQQQKAGNLDEDDQVVSFYRPVSPFQWHKKWSGTAWTWGIQAGNRGWKVDELDDNSDAWHGISPPELWNLRLPGGISIQAPRVLVLPSPVTDDDDFSYATESNAGTVDLLRVAWLPFDDKLIRLEAGIVGLRPRLDEEGTSITAIEQPKLISYRCDILNKVGELDQEPSFLAEQQQQLMP